MVVVPDHDSRLRSIFRKHARESALTSLGALLVPFGSSNSQFGGAPVAPNSKRRRAWQRFAIVILNRSATNDDAVLRESLSHSTHKIGLYFNTHRMMEGQQSPSIEARDAPLAVNSRLQNLRRRCGGREWGSTQMARRNS